MIAIRTFICYSQDTAKHIDRVRHFADQLRKHGIDAELDQYHTRPLQGWKLWCEEQLRRENSKFVLVICTKTLKELFQGTTKSRGIIWERKIIYNYLFDGDERFLPVLLDDAPEDCVPAPLNSDPYKIHQFEFTDQGYENLYRTLTHQPKAKPPKVGQQRVLPPHGREIGTASGKDIQFSEPLPKQKVYTDFMFPDKYIAHSRLLDMKETKCFDTLVNRVSERKQLTDAWNDETKKILVYVSESGVGKTSLVADWLMDFVNNDWADVDAFIDWSFSRQETQGQNGPDSKAFFDYALEHFGIPTPDNDGKKQKKNGDSRKREEEIIKKANQLAECVTRQRTLLVIDGLEQLQYLQSPDGIIGELKDSGIKRLLMRLAQKPFKRGLCVVTTRMCLNDLQRFHDKTVWEYRLGNLTKEEGARLLFRAGAIRAGNKNIKPNHPELLNKARDFKGHALTLYLLGVCLKEEHNGDILCCDRVNWHEIVK